MRRRKPTCPVFCFSFLLFILLISGVSNSHAQGFSSLSSSTNSFLSQTSSSVGQFFSQDLPGAFDSAMPLLFPPYFGGEIRIRPSWYELINGEIDINGQKIDLESAQGIGLSSKGAYVEFMMRLQFSRLSLRAHYYADYRRIPAGDGYVDWPTWRFGADLDLIDAYGIRFGGTADYNTERPSMKYRDLGSSNLSGEIKGYQPLTFGIVAAYNPFTSWVVSPSLEFRYRWPYVYRPEKSLGANPSRVTEWEWAAGLKLPKTVLGSAGLRIGYKETLLEFAGGAGSGDRSSVIKLQTGGYFGELVWFY